MEASYFIRHDSYFFLFGNVCMVDNIFVILSEKTTQVQKNTYLLVRVLKT